jgi:hypothetical protein
VYFFLYSSFLGGSHKRVRSGETSIEGLKAGMSWDAFEYQHLDGFG